VLNVLYEDKKIENKGGGKDMNKNKSTKESLSKSAPLRGENSFL